jgi:hypothetical protein
MMVRDDDGRRAAMLCCDGCGVEVVVQRFALVAVFAVQDRYLLYTMGASSLISLAPQF